MLEEFTITRGGDVWVTVRLNRDGQVHWPSVRSFYRWSDCPVPIERSEVVGAVRLARAQQRTIRYVA
jgi:hypothetical protein